MSKKLNAFTPKKKIKIGMFIDSYYPMIDGVIIVVDNYARILTKNKNCEVVVFCPNAKRNIDDNLLPYKVVRCKSIKNKSGYSYGLPFFDKTFRNKIKEENLDIVHIHSPFNLGKMGVKFAKKNKLPVVASLHSQYKIDFMSATRSKLITKLLLHKIMKVFNDCDICFPVNQKLAYVYKTQYKLKTPTIIMNNATDMEPIIKKKGSSEIDARYNLSNKDNIFLFVGRLTKKKNIFFIIDALKQVKFMGINFKMLFVGKGTDEKKLITHIENCGLKNQVIMCGEITNKQTLRKIYERAKLFLFPSLYDTNSLVQIEAASQRTPTVFLRDSVTASCVKEDISGFKTENNVKAYANKIVEIMTNDHYYEKVSEGAFNYLYKNWESVTNEVYKEYNKLLKNI